MTRSLYALWRRRRWSADGLREAPASPPPERLMQAIWQHQRLRRDALRLVDGRPVRVLHPGFANRESGPDFRQAVLQCGQDPARVGDVEVDLRPELWRAHRHHQNPAFGQVFLHVVWDPPASPLEGIPTLALLPFIDSPLEDLVAWLTSAEPREDGFGGRGHCSEALAGLPLDRVREILRQASFTRLQVKAQQFEARARQAGWSQALWEGLFRALGYKHNAWAMQRLAELLPELSQPGESLDRTDWQARLLGVAGLIADEPSSEDPQAARYLVRLWDHWWRARNRWVDAILPAELWRFGGVRPANHPQRRIALAAHWLARGDLTPRLERCFAAGGEDLPERLLDMLHPPPDEFWDRHWTLQSRPMTEAQPMLGLPRVSDLAVNVVLPWLWIRARACDNHAFRLRVEQEYFQWPAAEDNAVLRRVRQRLFPGGRPGLVKTASDQQGLLQIGRDWCDHFDATCQQCPWPELIRGSA